MLYTTHLAHIAQEKVSPQTNSSYIFLLGMNFKNLTVGLHILIMFSMLAKFQEN